MAEQYEEKMMEKYLPLRIGHLTERFIEQAKKELNETEEVKEKALKELRKRVQADKTIHQPDDPFLIEFLRPRKFDVDRAYKLLMSFFDTKIDYKECFENVNLDELINGFAKSGVFSYLPYRSPDGCVIFLIELAKWDTSLYTALDAIRLGGIIALSCLEDPITQITGVKVVINSQGASLKIIKFLTPRFISLLSRVLRNCIPVRFKGIHFVNESMVIQYLWPLLKIFLLEKIKKRVHFHADNMKSLHNFIPKELLTEDYGGCNKYFNHGEMCVKLLEEHRDRIPEFLRFGTKK